MPLATSREQQRAAHAKPQAVEGSNYRRISIVTDIHDETAILAVLRAERVDVIKSLGDTSDMHGRRQDGTDVATRSFGSTGRSECGATTTTGQTAT